MTTQQTSELTLRIAERANRLSPQREIGPGGELELWLEAESQVKGEVAPENRGGAVEALLAGASVLLVPGGCAVVESGREFNLPGFDARVEPGATTQADVRDWLGEPTGLGQSVESSGERFEQWTYYHGEGRLPRIGDGHFSLLQIKFDRRDVVYAYNGSAEAR